MAAGNYNLLIEQGATFQRTFVWNTSDKPYDPCKPPPVLTPVDITDFTAVLTIGSGFTNPTIYHVASTANGEIILGGAAGTIAVTIPASITTTFDWKKGVYDLNLESSGGIVTRLLQGAVTLSPEVI